ncbi:MAG: PhoH family protein [Firmicutes bacterium]|nr:PhoH family protein [Bacillota bacterium]
MTVYVLDSNVLLSDPDAIYSFPESEVVIPSVVIEEIDSKKHGINGTAFNARQVARHLDHLRKTQGFKGPVYLENESTLRVELNHRSLECLRSYFSEPSNDNRLLAVALNIQAEETAKEVPGRVVLVSQDAFVRIKADALGLETEDYQPHDGVRDESDYTGWANLEVEQAVIEDLYSNGVISAGVLERILEPNQYVILKCAESTQSAIGRYSEENRQLQLMVSSNKTIWGIKPRNVQQRMAIDLLLDNSVPLVTLSGCAGTGKTLMALAAGLYLSQEDTYFNRLMIARPVIPMGRDIGYLPGSKEDKLRPWMQPIYDNLEMLFSQRKGSLDEILVGMKNIQVEALTYIRGRTLPNQYIIIDEAQNLTKHEVKTVVSRVGEGSKIVLLGDLEQIDHPYLDRVNNGLAHVIEKFKNQSIAGHVTLVKGERSNLARLAASVL